MKTKTYAVNVRINAIVSFNVQAESLESALTKAREETKRSSFFCNEIEYIDGSEEIVGVDAPWDLE